METLRLYLNSLPVDEQIRFAERCGTTLGYLRKALSTKPKFNVELCMRIEEQSDKKVPCEDLRPDFDWAYMRGREVKHGEAA
jgi:DNA-binding transcriptional regulator YdaS (Cro superfamily)